MSVRKCWRSPVHNRKEDRGYPQCASAGVRWCEAESRRREQRREEEEAEQRQRPMKRPRHRKPQQTTSVYMDDRALTATTSRGLTACTVVWMDWSEKVGLQENEIKTQLTAS